MVLIVGESYTAANGITEVIQGGATQEQKRWWEENAKKTPDERTYRLPTPAEDLYLALCQNGFKLQEALESCRLTEAQKAAAQRALNILVNENGVVKKITRPSFVSTDLRGRDLREADLRGARLQGANLYKAQMQRADLRGARLQGAKLGGADLGWADLGWADLRGADLRGAFLWGADISGANFDDAKNLNTASLKLAFYCQDNPPQNLEDALNGVDAKQRPMALTKQEYDNVCRLRDSNNRSAFGQELRRLRLVYDSRDKVNAAKARFAWCKPLVPDPTNLAIMFSQGFDAPTRAAWYGNDAGGRVLQGISNGLEFLNNHLGDRESR